MKKIAITGNIASGKSEIEKILTEKGYKVICADKISRRIFESDKGIRQEIYDFFKTNDRKEIADIVFVDVDKRQVLEEITHPQIKKEILNFFEKNKGEKLVFATIPLLFEANMQDMFDYIILVCADEKTRLGRLLKRNNFDKKQALLRIKSQVPQEEHAPRADFIIDNNGSVENLAPQVENILKNLEKH